MKPETLNLIIGGVISLASICLTSIVTLLTLILSNFFQNKREDKKRRQELEDRAFNRRVAIHDIRVQEARDYLDKMTIFLSFAGNFADILKDANRKQVVKDEVEIYRDLIESFPTMANEMSIKGASLEILNDDEIKNLFKDLRPNIIPIFTKFTEISDVVLNEEDNVDMTKLKDGIDFDKTTNSLREADKIISKMKARLDKLAVTLR